MLALKALTPTAVLLATEFNPLPTVRPDIEASLAVVSVVPLNVRFAESVKFPPVVA